MSEQVLEDAKEVLLSAQNTFPTDVDVLDLAKYISDYEELIAEKNLASVTSSSSTAIMTNIENRTDTLELKLFRLMNSIRRKLLKITSTSSTSYTQDSSSSSTLISSTTSSSTAAVAEEEEEEEEEESSSSGAVREYTLEDVNFLMSSYKQDIGVPLYNLNQAFTAQSQVFVDLQSVANRLATRIQNQNISLEDIKVIIYRSPELLQKLRLIGDDTLKKILYLAYDFDDFEFYRVILRTLGGERREYYYFANDFTLLKKVLKNKGSSEFQQLVLKQDYWIYDNQDFGFAIMLKCMEKCIKNRWNETLAFLLKKYKKFIIEDFARYSGLVDYFAYEMWGDVPYEHRFRVFGANFMERNFRPDKYGNRYASGRVYLRFLVDAAMEYDNREALRLLKDISAPPTPPDIFTGTAEPEEVVYRENPTEPVLYQRINSGTVVYMLNNNPNSVYKYESLLQLRNDAIRRMSIYAPTAAEYRNTPTSYLLNTDVFKDPLTRQPITSIKKIKVIVKKQ